MTIKNYIFALVGFLVIAMGAFLYTPALNVEGAAFTGTVARLDLATTTAVGPQAVPAARVFTTNTTCNARVITTQGASAVMISFGEPITPGNISSTSLSGTVGHLQLASTTVAYDSGIYGCGQWHVWAWASSTITVSEF